MLRACGVLTSDPAAYAESLRQLAIQRVVVAQGCYYPSHSAGWTPRGPQQPAPEARLQRAVEVTAPGLSVTPASLALAAVVLLEEGGAVGVRGFATPVATLHRTSFWRRLVERCVAERGKGVCPEHTYCQNRCIIICVPRAITLLLSDQPP